MGNYQDKLNAMADTRRYPTVDEFEFHNYFEEQDFTNGLLFNNKTLIPEEILVNILSRIPPKDLLKYTLVCKKWCNIIKSTNLWITIYNDHHKDKGKTLPWYVYYNYFTTDNYKNLLRNGNGEKSFNHWHILKNGGDGFRIEHTPAGADPLPTNIPEFNRHTSCFVTSFGTCLKRQRIILKHKRLLRYIIKKYKPTVYASEWVAGRFDCVCSYFLQFSGHHDPDYPEGYKIGDDPVFRMDQSHHIPSSDWELEKWRKVEIVVRSYKRDFTILDFEHAGKDGQFWKGHYGSKMAGGVVKFCFDTIQPQD